MPSIKLSADETAKRFGVAKAIDNFPTSLTSQEEKNVKTVLKYMEVRTDVPMSSTCPTHAHGRLLTRPRRTRVERR